MNKYIINILYLLIIGCTVVDNNDITDPLESGLNTKITNTTDPLESGLNTETTNTTDPLESGLNTETTNTTDPLESKLNTEINDIVASLESTLNISFIDALSHLGSTSNMDEYSIVKNITNSHFKIIMKENLYLASSEYKIAYADAIDGSIDSYLFRNKSAKKFTEKGKLTVIENFSLIANNGDSITDLNGFNTIYSQQVLEQNTWLSTQFGGKEEWISDVFTKYAIKYILVKQSGNKFYSIPLQKSDLNSDIYQILFDDFQEAEKNALIYTKK